MQHQRLLFGRDAGAGVEHLDHRNGTALACAAWLAACGGGGSDASADTSTSIGTLVAAAL